MFVIRQPEKSQLWSFQESKKTITKLYLTLPTLSPYSQALLFLLVLAGCSVLVGRLCYCLSFSLSKVQCYLCNKKVKKTSLYTPSHPLIGCKCIYYTGLSIKEPLIFVIFVRCISFSIKYVQRPRITGIWISAFIEYFLFLDFPTWVGVWEAQKELFREVRN